MNLPPFISIAEDMDLAGLIWVPEIGDEVSSRKALGNISILVDPQGLTPAELRSTYLWLPTVEQMVLQIESRQAILFHAGLELSTTSFCYKTVLRRGMEIIEKSAESLRISVGLALRELLLNGHKGTIN